MQSGKDVHSSFVANLPAMSPYLGAILGLHIATQFVLPVMSPQVFDFLGKKQYGKRALSSAERSELARDARTKAVAVVSAVWMVYSAVTAISDPSFSSLKGHIYAGTQLTHQAMLLAAAYFTWDVVVCVWDAEPAAFIFHGAACWFIYVSALGVRVSGVAGLGGAREGSPASDVLPFNQAIWTWGMLFEASTPFLHLRTAMIQADAARGPLFLAVQWLFGGFFLASRIIMGYIKAYEFFGTMEAAVAARQVHSVGLVRLCEVLSFLLCGLNAYWLYLMIRRAVSPSAPVKDKIAAKLEAMADTHTTKRD